MFKTSPVIKGTIILTLAGIITKIIGFFFKIYLSYIIGAKGIGIYQLIFPIYLVCITISCLGIETSISKYCAEKFSQNDTKSAKKYLFCGLFLSLILSLICSLILHFKADFIAINIIHEKSCAPLLSLLAYAIPFAAVHSCINGFLYARKKTTIPAITQLVEQIARVSSVYIISAILIERSQEITPQIAVLGIVMGEIASTLFSLTAFSISPININHSRRNISNSLKSAYNNIAYLINLIKMTVPLTMNNLIINLLQSYEAIIIPIMLRKCGMSSDEALNMYGILTGMAMPLVFFPSALTNSASIMLLPKIAEANASKNNKSITSTAHVTMEACLFLGIFFTGIFFMYGKEMGIYIFSSETAGRFIRTLGFICPFLYMSTTITSMLNGLGKTTTTLMINVTTLLIRITSIITMVPKYGIIGYLFGILTSLLIKTLLCSFLLKKHAAIVFKHTDWVLKPIISMIISLLTSFTIYQTIDTASSQLINFIYLGGCIALSGIIYLMFLHLFKKRG